MTRFLGYTRYRELWNTTHRRSHLQCLASQHDNYKLETILTMTRSDVHSWPTGAKRAIRWNFRKLCVFKETLLICHCADVDLFRNTLVRLAYSRGFRFPPTDDCSHRVYEDRIEGWKADWLHWASQWHWVFQCYQSNVRIEIFAVELPILMDFNFNKISLLRMFFEIS